jgi:hypothetical protein
MLTGAGMRGRLRPPSQLPALLADAETVMHAHTTLQGQAADVSTRLFCALKDTRTLLRMLAAMAPIFVDAFEMVGTLTHTYIHTHLSTHTCTHTCACASWPRP